jgi:hypothetical protein
MSENRTKPASSADERPDWLDIVRRQVGSLRYGVVQVVVHDSQVTQIDETERVRLETLAQKPFKADQNTGGVKKSNELLTGQPEVSLKQKRPK